MDGVNAGVGLRADRAEDGVWGVAIGYGAGDTLDRVSRPAEGPMPIEDDAAFWTPLCRYVSGDGLRPIAEGR